MKAKALATNTETLECGPIAQEIARTVDRYVSAQAEILGTKPEDSLAQVEQPDNSRLDRASRSTPKNFSWLDYYSLAKQDPQRAEERWNEVKQVARQELLSGHRAASSTEGTISSSAWQRAQFLAIRTGLAEEWGPQSGIEWTLVDTMAQAFTTQLFWQEWMMAYACLEPDGETAKQQECIQYPRVSDSRAVEQAAEMVDRFNRIFMRSLRALRDLRRHAPTLVVHNATQVNVADNQVNLDLG